MHSGLRRDILLFTFSMLPIANSGCSAFSASPSASSRTEPAPTTQVSGFVLSSSAFSEGGNIPKRYSCDGEGVSPALEWRGAPAATKSFVLIVDDPDAPSGTFTHWVVFDIPGNVAAAPDAAKDLGKGAKNGRGQTGYTGPCPPSGTHRYFFTLYALDTATLGINDGSTRAQVENAMKSHIIAQAVLMGKYAR